MTATQSTASELQLAEAVKHVSEFFGFGASRPAPTILLISGSGLSDLASDPVATLGYDSIPGFPRASVAGHGNELVLQEVEDKLVLAMNGRFHLYEGYTPQEVTFPVRLARALGIRTMIITNACGGMNPGYAAGDIMLIEDHINMMGTNPLIGPNHTQGPRFPDMSEPYSAQLRRLATDVAKENDTTVHSGVYVGVTGPCLETNAEYKMLRAIGADVVGMSTVPEVIVARHAGMQVLGFSVVTDLCVPPVRATSFDEIMHNARLAEPALRKLIRGCIARM
ncbi:MAG: purine-nucleoside phosphorylase [Gemmatimonadales bacterium]